MQDHPYHSMGCVPVILISSINDNVHLVICAAQQEIRFLLLAAFSVFIDNIRLATDCQRSLSSSLLQTSETTSVASSPIVKCEEQEEEAAAE